MCWDISATSLSVSELVAPGVIAGKTDGGDGPRGGDGAVWLMSLAILRFIVIVSLLIDDEISQKRRNIPAQKHLGPRSLVQFWKTSFGIKKLQSPNSLNWGVIVAMGETPISFVANVL